MILSYYSICKPNEQSAEIDEYSLSSNVTALTATSRVYFLEETEDLRYKVIFGDGVLGRKLIDNEFIVLEYITTDGPKANGANKFSFIGQAVDVTGRAVLPSQMSLATIDSSQSGEERESALSVKFRALGHSRRRTEQLQRMTTLTLFKTSIPRQQQ